MDLTSIQLMQGAAGAAGGSTYVDDVFSTYLYAGNSNTLSVNNGIDNTKGGMIWFKVRTDSDPNLLFDTERGTSNYIQSNSSDGQSTSGVALTSFDNDGYTIAASSYQNNSGRNYASWNFRKQKGLFDVVQYSGTGSNQTVNHNLGCIPGLILTKRIDSNGDWIVYHRSLGPTKALRLDSTDGQATGSSRWNDTAPTATTFSLGSYSHHNASGSTNIAYLFAGGESTASNARSVDFDGSDDYLSLASSSDFNFGTDDFTVEGWCYRDGGFFTMFDHLMGGDQFIIFSYDNGDMRVYSGGGGGHLVSGVNPGDKQWFHLAVVRASGKLRIYINGTHCGATHNFTFDITQAGIQIGRSTGGAAYTNGRISNLRVVKGTAVYTSSFKPSTVPLTSISGTVLLCCNDSSVTGKTTGGTITATGSPTASISSPFDDPEGFKFGAGEDQNIIKCGSYEGNGSSTGPTIDLGWEPQWLLVKNTNLSTEQWFILDSMRGIFTAEPNIPIGDPALEASRNVQEGSYELIELTPTGFKVRTSDAKVNNNGGQYVYVAIRRPDPLVAKPPEAGTDVFALVNGTSSSSIPAFVSGHVTDFVLMRKPAATENWYSQSRMTGTGYMAANTTTAEATSNDNTWDFMNGYYKSTSNWSAYQAWMWKRHAGFDVVTYMGNGVIGHTIRHSLNKIPEMIWLKERNTSLNWYVNHKDLTGGGSYASWRGALRLNGNQAAWESGNVLGDASTSNTFTLGDDTDINGNNDRYIAFLFASVEGISKVGSYTGTGSSLTITTGFTPRFLLIKNRTASDNWRILDTLRGWGSGNDCQIRLSSSSAQSCNEDWGAPISTGFTLSASSDTAYNKNGDGYIYYAHA